jgi:hypothetical protein
MPSCSWSGSRTGGSRQVAEKGNKGFADGVRRAEYGVDQRHADAATLVVRMHAERAERQNRRGFPKTVVELDLYLFG